MERYCKNNTQWERTMEKDKEMEDNGKETKDWRTMGNGNKGIMGSKGQRI